MHALSRHLNHMRLLQEAFFKVLGGQYEDTGGKDLMKIKGAQVLLRCIGV